jgi:predicted nucleic acid-binding protein
MILIDAGPLVALFDPADADHARCAELLRAIDEPLVSTIPALTETFHLIAPESIGGQALMDFIVEGGMSITYLDDQSVGRAFELMVQYGDHPMDFADASLMVAAETLRIRKVFTLNRSDFASYRVKRGHRHYLLEIVGAR